MNSPVKSELSSAVYSVSAYLLATILEQANAYRRSRLRHDTHGEEKAKGRASALAWEQPCEYSRYKLNSPAKYITQPENEMNQLANKKNFWSGLASASDRSCSAFLVVSTFDQTAIVASVKIFWSFSRLSDKQHKKKMGENWSHSVSRRAFPTDEKQKLHLL